MVLKWRHVENVKCSRGMDTFPKQCVNTDAQTLNIHQNQEPVRTQGITAGPVGSLTLWACSWKESVICTVMLELASSFACRSMQATHWKKQNESKSNRSKWTPNTFCRGNTSPSPRGVVKHSISQWVWMLYNQGDLTKACRLINSRVSV